MTTRRAACALTFLATLGMLAASAAPAVAGCTESAEASIDSDPNGPDPAEDE